MEKIQLRFNGTWRSYQKRILDNLQQHLQDNKLHVVAAPGAGKTTLGIEIIARLNRPALVLCPTNTIKHQWRDRICSSFLTEDNRHVVSINIRKPGLLTITTYQALLAAFCGQAENEEAQGNNAGEQEEADSNPETDNNSIASSARFKKDKADEIIDTLRKSGISLLCFDEAHHLRKEWWKALTYLNEQLKPEQTLALTATPPYDAEYGEWKRYQELCGEIDEVISIPELVKNGDLCPHQDFIWFSPIKQNERKMLRQHSENIRTLIGMVTNDTELLESLREMKFFEPDDTDVEQILESPEFYVSIASLLKSKGYLIPERFLQLFDATQRELPEFNFRKASVFIQGFLECEADYFKPLEAKRSACFDAAKRLGLVYNKKVVLNGGSKYRKLIAGSLGKLDAIVQIVRLESNLLRKDLRMVILADYIRMNDTTCESIGVVPIWKKLKEDAGCRVSVGVLCGSLILIPENTLERFRSLLSDNGVAEDCVTVGRFNDEDGYVRLTPKESAKNIIVSIITELFCAGDVTVLVGTQALLGEGWDAPAINSLILSSTVTSYMLSNQMRGRAIRIDRNNPGKVSNIWHLASYDFPDKSDFSSLGSISDIDLDALSIYDHDLEQLKTRFEGYEAPSYYGKHEITSGIERIMERPKSFGSSEESDPQAALKAAIEHVRAVTPELASDREQTRQWWKKSLYSGYGNNRQMRLTTGVEEPRMTMKGLVYFSDRSKFIFALTAAAAVLFISLVEVPALFPHIAWVTVAVTAMYLEPFVAGYLKTGTPEGIIRQIAITVLETMKKQGFITSSIKIVGLRVNNYGDCFFVSCTNLPAEENNLFIQSLQELLDPVDNPRYILIRYTKTMGEVVQTDYFSVPAILSSKRQDVEYFKTLWEKNIGECEIIYTRNLEGRKILLKARKDASSAINRPHSKRLSKWQ